MIFYFSGTGNSLYAAQYIAKHLNQRLISIVGEFDKKKPFFEYTMQEDGLLGFVFPVYAWGPPRIVLDFLTRLKVSGSKPYVFSLSTCGDEEGYTTRIMQKALNKNGLHLDSAFSLIMPNNYIVGFDVDPKDLEQEKLRKAEQKLQTISSVLKERRKGVFDIIPGKLSGLKTSIVNPLFNHFARNTKSFYATDQCTKCGLCESVCPLHTITVQDKPIWGRDCTQCLACIHHCPVQAIQYGKGTIRKGRYVNPYVNERV